MQNGNSPRQSNQRHPYHDDGIVELLREVDVREVARHLGIELDRHGRGACPLCGTSPRSQAFSVDPKRPAFWKCFACNEGSNALGLVMAITKCSFAEAKALVADAAGIDIGQPVNPATRARADARRRERDVTRRRERWRNRAAHVVADLIHEARWRRRVITRHPADRERDADDLACIAHAEAWLLGLHEALCDRDEAVAYAALEKILDVEVVDEDEVAA